MFNDQFQPPGRSSFDSSYQNESSNIHVLRFNQALNLFNYNVAKGKSRYLLLWLFRQPRKLLHLADLNLVMAGSSELGSRVVLINHIRGTEGRVKDFDIGFYPLAERLRDRWVSVATAHLQGIGLPAVDLIQVGDKYYVRDGHHRISVAKALGQEEIDARITLWRTSD